MVKKPNFFILGAPKCGTTSLGAWLAKHPQVFFSPVKEPFFFNFDFGDRRFRSISRYNRLFLGVGDQHIAVGEGSTRYLYSRAAVPAILKYTKAPRFIVMTRNPVEMVYSLHEQTLFNGDETEETFEEAWKLQDIRAYGAHIPTTCNDPQLLFYGDRCRIGDQLKRLLRIVRQDQILVLNLDHIKRDTQQQYLKVLDFLGVADDSRRNFPVFNSAKERNFPGLWRFVRWVNRTLRETGVPHVRVGFTSFFFERARRERPRPPMKKEMRLRLVEYFRDDIILLEQLTGWDLSAWKSVE